MNKEKWVWMPHPGHFCGCWNCNFRMNTYVGKYIVSTVGEYLPDGRDGKRHTLGLGKTDYYETMVFRARKSNNKCCPYEMSSGEVDTERYGTPEEARKGHLKMCEKWSNRKKEESKYVWKPSKITH